VIRLIPTTISEAKRFVGRHHRHNDVPKSALFAAGCGTRSGPLVGVVIVGRPKAGPLDDGWTAEAVRVATDGTDNACSMLYAAAARAARALGYQSIVTYTLAEEPGTSLEAAGWEREAELPARPSWDTPSRRRVQVDLFGEERRPSGPKTRWRKWLVKSERQRQPRPRRRGPRGPDDHAERRDSEVGPEQRGVA